MNVRELAVQVINNIYKNKSFSNIELSKTIRENNLSELDKSFLTKLVYGTLKKSNVLNYEISKVTENKEIKPLLRTILKTSLYQLRYMDKVPGYAVINEGVEITKNLIGLQASKFANAVLRKLQSNVFQPSMEEYENELDFYSFINGIPNWVSKMVEKHYGYDVALNYVKSSSLDCNVSMRVNTLRTTKEEILKNAEFKESKLSECGVLYTGNKSLNELDAFMSGKLAVQGESSQLVGPFLGPKENDYILDMCAAPGGKTYHIADLLNNKGSIVSIDLYPHRVDLLKQNLPRLGITCVKTKAMDATLLHEKFEKESFDKILLDAPCSGLGIIRKKPDILLNLDQNKLDGIIELQKSLIDEAYLLLKKKGILVYSTCTINKKENEKQVEYLLEKYPDMKLLEKRNIFPDEDIVDGFFMAKFVKE